MRCVRDKKVTQLDAIDQKSDHKIDVKIFLKIMHQIITPTNKLFKSHKVSVILTVILTVSPKIWHKLVKNCQKWINLAIIWVPLKFADVKLKNLS